MKTRLYRLTNGARDKRYFLARNKEDAIGIALAFGFAKKAGNLKIVDSTKAMLLGKHMSASSLRKALNAGLRGIGAVYISNNTAEWEARLPEGSERT